MAQSSGSGYQPPSSPAYTSTQLPPPRTSAGAAAPGSATTPPTTPAAHLAGTGGTGGKGRRGWIIAAILLVIALVGAGGAYALLGGDDDNDDAAPATEDAETSLAEPVGVAQAFFTAAVAGDCPGMADLLTEGSLLRENDSAEEAVADCETNVAEGDTGFEDMTVGNVSLVSVEGDTAVVSVDFDIAGQASTEQYTLQRVDGEWKMDLEASA